MLPVRVSVSFYKYTLRYLCWCAEITVLLYGGSCNPNVPHVLPVKAATFTDESSHLRLISLAPKPMVLKRPAQV